MALTTEEKKERVVTVYPAKPDKDKFRKYAEKKSMSMSKVLIEGAKLYMRLNPII